MYLLLHRDANPHYNNNDHDYDDHDNYPAPHNRANDPPANDQHDDNNGLSICGHAGRLQYGRPYARYVPTYIPTRVYY